MESTLSLWIVAVAAVCLGTIHAAPVPGEADIDTLHFLGEKACRLVNETSDVTVERMCGCGNETSLGVSCQLGPEVKLTDSLGNQLTATFCDQKPVRGSDNSWAGVLAGACRITQQDDTSVVLKDDPCPAEVTCVDDAEKTISFFVDGTEVVASFCETQLQEQTEEASAASDSESSQSEDSESTSEDSEDATSSGPAEDASSETEEQCISLDED